MRRMLLVALGALALATTGCTMPDFTTIGLNRPAPGLGKAFGWKAVPGASAYQVVITMDRAGTQPAGISGFTSDTHVAYQAVVWREGNPIKDRPYFWVIKAYDRPDPQGLLLTQSEPIEVVFSEPSEFTNLSR